MLESLIFLNLRESRGIQGSSGNFSISCAIILLRRSPPFLCESGEFSGGGLNFVESEGF